MASRTGCPERLQTLRGVALILPKSSVSLKGPRHYARAATTVRAPALSSIADECNAAMEDGIPAVLFRREEVRGTPTLHYCAAASPVRSRVGTTKT